MVFGELLGGLAIRGGQRMHEDLLHQRAVEDWQRESDLSNWQNFVSKNWDNLDADQQTATINRGAQILGKKPKDFEFMVNAARAIHSTIPSQPSAPALGGPRMGPVAVTPSKEPDIRGIAAPPQIEIGQIPQPSETATPSIFAPTTSHAAVSPQVQVGEVPQLAQGQRMVSQTPNEVLAQRKRRDEERARQQKVAEIMGSTMDPEDKALAIKALHIPGAVLAAQERLPSGGASTVGLNLIELVSPDGKTIINAQPTRTGQFIEAGTGRVIDPARIAGWTKRHAYAPWIGIGQDSSPVVVNREEIARSGLGSIAGTVPDVKVAETRTPLVDVNKGTIAGDIGSRSGIGGIRGQGVPVGNPNDPNAPPPPEVELGRSARPKAELDARTYLDQAQKQLETIQEIASRRPDLIGPWDYMKQGVIKRGLGQQDDADANNLYNSLERFKEDFARAREGAVIPPAMLARLEKMAGGRAWTNEVQFKDDVANAVEAIRTQRGGRSMPTSPNVTGREGRNAKGGGTNGAAGPISLRRKSDGRTASIPREAWNKLTPAEKALYERQ